MSDGFLGGVAGKRRESGVNRLDRAGVVGNHDGIGCRIECCGLHAKLFLGAFALGYFRLQRLIGLRQFCRALLDPLFQLVV